MSFIAVTREVSPAIADCQLSFHERQPIDLAKAMAQHRAYQDCLAELGTRIVALPAEAEFPDSVFVEDTALVLDELAVIANIGTASRRGETSSVADALAPYRPLKFITDPARLDGGDVLRVGRSIFVGLSRRTNREAVEQLRELLAPHQYQVEPIAIKGCLHLKTACSYIGNNTVLINRACIETEPLRGYELVDVPADEVGAANVLLLNDTVIMPASFPTTRALLQERSFHVQTVDVSELQKAEAGVTCCSLIFSVQPKGH
jgi:dimethylargininase